MSYNNDFNPDNDYAQDEVVSEYSIDYTPPPTIQRMILTPRTFNYIHTMGPIGSGKSTGEIMKLLYEAMQQSPHPLTKQRQSRYAIVRNTNQQLKDTTLKSVVEWIKPGGPLASWKASEMMLTINFPMDDDTTVYSEWLFRALDTQEDIRKLLSLELSGAWINEGREVPEVIYDALFTRTGRYPKKLRRLIKDPNNEKEKIIDRSPEGVIYQCDYRFVLLDSNPPAEGSWLYQVQETRCPETTIVYKQPSGLSPEAENRDYLPDDYYTALVVKHGADSEIVRTMVEGKYGKRMAGSAVYEKNFDYEMHTRSDSILRPLMGRWNSMLGMPCPIIIGVDFGRTPSATIGPVGPGQRILILDEVVTENMDFKTFLKTKIIPLLSLKYKGHPVAFVGDPAGNAKSDNDSLNKLHILTEFGFYGEFATTNGKLDNTPDSRIGAVNEFLTTLVEGQPKMLISREGCPVLIEGFRYGYRYKEKKREEDAPDMPVKNMFSHVHDGLQYHCMGVNSGIDARRVEMYKMEDEQEDEDTVPHRGRNAVTGY